MMHVYYRCPRCRTNGTARTGNVDGMKLGAWYETRLDCPDCGNRTVLIMPRTVDTLKRDEHSSRVREGTRVATTTATASWEGKPSEMVTCDIIEPSREERT